MQFLNRTLVLCALLFCPYVDALEYGIAAKHAGTIPIKKLVIFGERCSGTNYVDMLIARNFQLRSDRKFSHKHFPPWFELPIEYYSGTPAHYTFDNTDDYLFVIVFRNAYDWVRSLQQLPHHASAQLFKMPFSKFIRAPWELNPADKTVIRMRAYHPLMDLSPIDGKPFENVFKMRTKKIENMLMIQDRAKNVYYIRYEIIRDHPQEVIREIQEEFGIQAIAKYIPISNYLGWKHKGQFHQVPYPPLSLEDLDYINSQLSEEIENQIGYTLIYDPSELN